MPPHGGDKLNERQVRELLLPRLPSKSAYLTSVPPPTLPRLALVLV
jgi:hypothetical protein